MTKGEEADPEGDCTGSTKEEKGIGEKGGRAVNRRAAGLGGRDASAHASSA